MDNGFGGAFDPRALYESIRLFPEVHGHNLTKVLELHEMLYKVSDVVFLRGPKNGLCHCCSSSEVLVLLLRGVNEPLYAAARLKPP